MTHTFNICCIPIETDLEKPSCPLSISSFILPPSNYWPCLWFLREKQSSRHQTRLPRPHQSSPVAPALKGSHAHSKLSFPSLIRQKPCYPRVSPLSWTNLPMPPKAKPDSGSPSTATIDFKDNFVPRVTPTLKSLRRKVKNPSLPLAQESLAGLCEK